MALDHGRARTGVAVSDPTGTIVRPLAPIERIDSPAGRAALSALLEEQAPDMVVVGEPRLMSGHAGSQARQATAFAGRVRAMVAVPVELIDERLTTVEAARRAAESGSRTSVDSLAACVMLEAFLAAR